VSWKPFVKSKINAVTTTTTTITDTSMYGASLHQPHTGSRVEGFNR
jgi:Thr operon leader peptide